MTLEVVMIVKNEESCLKECLESVKGADFLTIVDTGSKDKTLEIAKKYTDKVFEYKWDDDFSAARNFAKSKCEADWCLSIDADEVLKSSIDDVRKVIEGATSQKTFDVNMIRKENKEQGHPLARIFRNIPEVEWKGAVHEIIYPIEKNPTDIVIEYGYSKAHEDDPDRNLRILKKAVAKDRKNSRNLFYLAREYANKNEYEKGVFYCHEYLKYANGYQERAHAYLILAKCYWNLGMANEARDVGIGAARENPDLREAWLFLADSHFSPWKEKYLQFAELATNKNAIFINCPKVTSQKIPKILHHLWVGPKPAPMEWINTWKEKHPDWEHILWDNDKVFGRKWINQRLIDEYRKQKCWHGVADVARYEILYEMGGFHPGADSICLHNTDELWADGFELYAVYENEKVRPGLITPLYASTPGHRFVKNLIDGLKDKEATEPWKTTGNMYMQEMVYHKMPPIMIFPSHYFNPVHYTGVAYEGTDKIYAEQQWVTTKSFDKIKNNCQNNTGETPK